MSLISSMASPGTETWAEAQPFILTSLPIEVHAFDPSPTMDRLGAVFSVDVNDESFGPGMVLIRTRIAPTETLPILVTNGVTPELSWWVIFHVADHFGIIKHNELVSRRFTDPRQAGSSHIIDFSTALPVNFPGLNEFRGRMADNPNLLCEQLQKLFDYVAIVESAELGRS